MQLRFGIAALIVAAVLGAGLVAAQPPDCLVRPCVYVPVVHDAPGGQVTPSATPTIGPIPSPGNGCDQHAPTPAEGLQAWMTATNPPPRTYTSLCARLIVGSRLVSGAPIQAVLHRAAHDEVVESSPGQDWSVTRIVIFSGDDNPGVVAIDVAARYLDRTYLAQTSFVSAPHITDTPEPTNTPTP